MTISQNKPRSDSSSSSRSVKFSARTKVYLVLSSKDMTDEEISSTWTTDEDSKRNQADIIKTIKAMRQAPSSRTKHNDESDMFCTRGLEHMQSFEQLEQRKINKASVLDSVLDEQDRQWGAGLYDEAKIAEASRTNSKWAVEKAVSMGSSDEAYSAAWMQRVL